MSKKSEKPVEEWTDEEIECFVFVEGLGLELDYGTDPIIYDEEDAVAYKFAPLTCAGDWIKLIDAMADKGWVGTLKKYVCGGGYRGSMMRIEENLEHWDNWIFVHQDTVPGRAICIAATKALLEVKKNA